MHGKTDPFTGLVRIHGNWESLDFLLRRGDGAFSDVQEMWRRIHSDEAIRRLKELNINLCLIHGHKGFGLLAEKESIREAAQWTAKLHDHGIKVGAYIGCTVFPEVFRDVPLDKICMENDSRGWSASQYYRNFWSWFRPEAMTYIKRVVKEMIENVHVDLLHFDASFSYYHDNLCHSKEAIGRFHEYIRTNIPEAVAISGLKSASDFIPPPCGNGAYVGGVSRMQDPVAVAWAIFHAEYGAIAFRELIDYAGSLKSDIAILFNGASLCGIHPYCRPENDLAKIRLADVFCTEDSPDNPVGLMPDGGPLSRFRAYKFAHRVRARSFYYTVEEGANARLMLAESAAFNYRFLGCVELAMQDNRILHEGPDKDFYDALIAHESLFIDRVPWVQIAVLRHNRSELLNPFPSGLAPYVIEQMLFESHHAFTLITEEDLKEESLQGFFDLIILPEARCLSDEEIECLNSYVQAGGNLLLLGDCASSTPLNRLRPHWGWKSLFQCDINVKKSLYEETAGNVSDTCIRAIQKQNRHEAVLDKGKAIFLARVEYLLPPKEKQRKYGGFYTWYSHEYWQAPANANDIHDAISTLLGNKQLWNTNLPRHVGIEGYRVSEGYRIFFVNYAHPKGGIDAGYISFNLSSQEISAIEFSTVKGNISLPLIKTNENEIRCDLPEWSLFAWLTVYCV